MKLKDLLAEGRFDMEGPDSPDEAEHKAQCMSCQAVIGMDSEFCEKCEQGIASQSDGDDDACPGCGRGPGDGYGADCNDPQGCGYWKDFAREAMEELRGEMQRDGAMGEAANSDFFDKYMEETIAREELKAKQLKAPVVAESYGKIRQKRVQELPQNRIRIGGK